MELLRGELEVKGLPAMLSVDVTYLVRSRKAVRVEPHDPTTEKEVANIILQRLPSDLSDGSGRQ